MFNNLSIAIKVQPAPIRFEQSPNFNKSTLNIKNWELKEYDIKTLTAKFEVNFSEPLQISQAGLPDKIEISFLSE